MIYGMVRGVKVNYGGFVDLSTKDWPGRAVCTVFFRGCPLRCSYCHNATIQTGKDERDAGEIIALIDAARPLVSGVIFSGGEPTMQPAPLAALCRAAKDRGLLVGIQTNGYFPDTLALLIDEGLVDRIALDYKSRWEGYAKRWEGYAGSCSRDYALQADRSIAICEDARMSGRLPEFEIVLTIFWGNEREIIGIADHLPRGTLVLQQGIRKRFWKEWTGTDQAGGSVRKSRREIEGERAPLSYEELAVLAESMKRLGRMIRIRTREQGEVVYESDRGCWPSCQR
ncbi:MAG TPA: anaerobic ribonucleoside-triphosphate reductase activating protein [Methanoregulaceae archaeon]|nr:anaerobic ribonucleoside-triphosphate reductase activating protein [Methanoregulaceae archaeon]HPD10197.1 anaerobic ribonucleoside-triphosphate reductase activating protein [Methanoregulaceae archaeon]HRT14585.1 anaerobic ribonucleoside-triphosphate reductase activating protein [Methanoregulaceae archaeon]HRU30156.1 anaerobic ribonucleoside-triphosphate reductase activating protein [Methanoregulaceae archaeon]